MRPIFKSLVNLWKPGTLDSQNIAVYVALKIIQYFVLWNIKRTILSKLILILLLENMETTKRLLSFAYLCCLLP